MARVRWVPSLCRVSLLDHAADALHASEEGRRRLAAPPGEVAGARACRFSGEVAAAGAGSFSREVEVAIPPAPFLSGGVQEHGFCD